MIEVATGRRRSQGGGVVRRRVVPGASGWRTCGRRARELHRRLVVCDADNANAKVIGTPAFGEDRWPGERNAASLTL